MNYEIYGEKNLTGREKNNNYYPSYICLSRRQNSCVARMCHYVKDTVYHGVYRLATLPWEYHITALLVPGEVIQI